MAIILLDTSVIFDHLNGRYGRTSYLGQLIEQGHVLACCPVNITEVYAGLRSVEEMKTDAFLNSLECFSGRGLGTVAVAACRITSGVAKTPSTLYSTQPRTLRQDSRHTGPIHLSLPLGQQMVTKGSPTAWGFE
jgi:hypothetical protein